MLFARRFGSTGTKNSAVRTPATGAGGGDGTGGIEVRSAGGDGTGTQGFLCASRPRAVRFPGLASLPSPPGRSSTAAAPSRAQPARAALVLLRPLRLLGTGPGPGMETMPASPRMEAMEAISLVVGADTGDEAVWIENVWHMWGG